MVELSTWFIQYYYAPDNLVLYNCFYNKFNYFVNIFNHSGFHYCCVRGES